MPDATSAPGWRPTRTTLLAGGLVLAGFALVSASWWFLLLVAVGALGPGILREIGWLMDKDELQRHADHRAGYHAFLVTGLLGFVLVALFRSGEGAVENPAGLATLFLSLLWFTWLLSSLLAFWGPRRALVWVLRIFGSVVLVFTIVSNLGPEWTGWGALLLHPLLALPFFLLAWSAARLPRLSGAMLLALAAAGAWWFLGGRPLADFVDGVVLIFVLGPLLCSGLALLLGSDAAEGERED